MPGRSIPDKTRARNPQRGAVLVLVMTLLAALFAAGATVLYLQLSATRSAGVVTSDRGSLYCAEAGLARARAYVAANQNAWSAMLDSDPTNNPPGYPIVGDIDVPPDGTNDFSVTIKDDDDELPPATNDPTKDSNLRVFIVSTCTKYANAQRTIMELVEFASPGAIYRNQSGQGSGNTNNAN